MHINICSKWVCATSLQICIYIYTYYIYKTHIQIYALGGYAQPVFECTYTHTSFFGNTYTYTYSIYKTHIHTNICSRRARTTSLRQYIHIYIFHIQDTYIHKYVL